MTRLATTPSASARLWSTSATLWIITLSVMAVFQFWRGAPIDGVIFALIAAIVIVERVARTRRPPSPAAAGDPDVAAAEGTPARPTDRCRLVIVLAIAVAAGIVIVVAPRTGAVSISLVAALGVGALALVWNHAPRPTARTPHSRHRTRIAWASLGITLCVWEALAYILSVVVPRGWIGFPTVSLLLEPAVDFDPTRALLTVIWLAAGVWLVAVTVTRGSTTRSTTRVGERS